MIGAKKRKTYKYKIYKYYDCVGNLLYIGCTLDIVKRTAAHRCTKDWFDDISKIEVVSCGDKKEAYQIERDMIIKDRPLYNLHFNIPKKPKKKSPYPPNVVMAYVSPETKTFLTIDAKKSDKKLSAAVSDILVEIYSNYLVANG